MRYFSNATDTEAGMGKNMVVADKDQSCCVSDFNTHLFGCNYSRPICTCKQKATVKHLIRNNRPLYVHKVRS